jgi:acyl-CoA reductase-like NAD-dependent aldehyde dehydrogenase
MIPRTKQDEFVTALKAHLDAFFPDGALKSYFFGRIVSTTNPSRLKDLLDRTQGQIVFGVKAKDQNGPEPTIVRDVKPGDSLLEE